MRKLPIAVALSAAVHGAAIAWVQTRPRPKPEAPRPVTTVELVEPAPPPAPKPDDEPVAVALLDDDTVPDRVPDRGRFIVPLVVRDSPNERNDKASAAKGAGSNGVGAIVGERNGKASASEVGGGPPHSKGMGMRGKSWQLGWNPSDAFETAFNAYDKPADIPPPPSGELHPSGGGTATSDQPAFKVNVARDGTVKIEDKPDVGDVHLAGIGIAGRASFDDWAMRKAGIDPYSSAKRQWLDKTRDERARIGMASRKEDLHRAPEFMKRNVAWAWSRTENDPEARKQALFDLWDDCAETGDDDLVAAGTGARLYLVGFIRAHLPQGATGAFTPDDLTRLNAHKRSSATFQPY